MIELVEQPDTALEREVRDYLSAAPPAGRVGLPCGEHDPRWLRVLRDGLHHRVMMLIARDDHANGNGAAQVKPTIRGYLPLAFVSSALFGRFLVSLPYLNLVGVIADDAATADALIARGVELAAKYDAQYLELRHGQPVDNASLPARRDEKVRMVLTLPCPTAPPADEPSQGGKKSKNKAPKADEPIPGAGLPGAEALWKAIDSKARNLVRKGDKSDLKMTWGGFDVLDGFYEVFAVNMRDLGTPVYAKRLFAGILEHLADAAELAVVTQAGKPIAGALLIHTPALAGGAVPASTTVPSASSLREFNSTNCNMWMYHRLLLRAIERGSAEFDFGRSSVDSGTYKFKAQWGALPRPTVWQYHVRRGDINAVRPDSPKYRRRIETWQKLPVWLTRLVGPAIVRGIP